MQRSIALLQFTRSIATSHVGDIGARLLSNSQASTSAVHSQVRNARSVSDASHRSQRPPHTSDNAQRDQYGGQAGRDERSSDPRDASFSDASPTWQSQASSDVSEPEVGFVQDGPYPYSPSEVEVVNVAGSTETGWEFLGSNDDDCITWFGVDFTRGKLPEVERNALLSDSTKEMMYQMHAHDKTRYSVKYLATLFSIRQQRVMAILTLKGMEHQTIPLPDSTKSPKPNHKAAPSTVADSATPSEASDTQPDDTGAAAAAAADSASAEADEELDPRAQLVKASMDEAAREVPAYLASIKEQAEGWQVDSTVADQPADDKTDNNIIMAWLRHLATNPFWLRPTKDERQAKADAAAAASGAAAPDGEDDDIADYDASEPLTEKEERAAAKAEQEEEQQQLQDEVQSQQRDRGPKEDTGESSDPKTEGVQRYMLSNPDFLSHIMENDVFDCHETSGTGERHIKYIPRYPKFEYFKDERPEALAADKEAGGKANIDRPLLSNWEHACEEQAATEEIFLVREFKERLEYNLQQVGAKLDRNSRFKNAPSRPKEGWSMVVQDVSDETNKKQYVAMPNGRTRGLNANERVYLNRMQPKRRKKIV